MFRKLPLDWFNVKISVRELENDVHEYRVVVRRPILGGWFLRTIGKHSGTIYGMSRAFDVSGAAARQIMDRWIAERTPAKLG